MFLITRPAGKAEITKHAFTQKGIPAALCPAQKIRPIPHITAPQTQYRCAIVTSTYAANWLVQQSMNLDFVVPIGNATADVLRADPSYSGVDILLPSEADSEGVLEMPFFNGRDTCSVLLIKGLNGRTLMTEKLTQRGYEVDTISVYERVPNISQILVRQVEELPITCIIVTSTEIAELIMTYFNSAWLDTKHWIAASERIANYLKQNNYTKITVSDGASDEAIMNAASQLTLR